LIDLKKAFNSVDHTTLLTILRDIFKVNIRLVLVIANFLNDRNILIKLGSFLSRPYKVNRGIGQGTVNGPLLFILFFNDVGKFLHDAFYTAFADDLAIYVSDTDVINGIARLETILCRINNWCSSVGLSINFSKTKLIIFHKPNYKLPPNLFLSCDGNSVELVSSFKYLGVILDDHFSSKLHYEHILSKISANTGVVLRLRKMLNLHMFTLLLNSSVNSYTDYCLSIWGPSRLSDLKNIQNKINELLAIYFYPKIAKFHSKRFWKDHPNADVARNDCVRAHSEIDYYVLLEKCNQFTLTERLQYYTLQNVYKYRSPEPNHSVSALKIMFKLPSPTTARVTRQQNNCETLVHNTAMFENSVKYYSTTLWNSLPSKIKDIVNDPIPKVSFKNSVTEWISYKIVEMTCLRHHNSCSEILLLLIYYYTT